MTDYVPLDHHTDFSWTAAVGAPLGGPLTTVTSDSVRYTNLPEHTVVVGKGMDIHERDGETVGELDELDVSDDGVITGLTISRGRFNKEYRSFPVENVAGVGVDYVRLTLTAAEIEAVEPTKGD